MLTVSLTKNLAEPDEYTGRRDALPEYYAYRDEGCDLNPTCLTCSLERCRYDLPNGMRTKRADDHRQRVVALVAQGMGVTTIAREVGVSRRTVFRLKAGMKVAA